MPNILMIINKLVFQFYHKCCLSVNNPLLKCGAITQGIEVGTGSKCIFELEKENIIAKDGSTNIWSLTSLASLDPLLVSVFLA